MPEPHAYLKADSGSKSTTHHKLPRLPKSTRISKRPLIHPPIRPAHQTLAAGEPSIIYISPSTPFISAVKRARKQLAKVRDAKLRDVTLQSLQKGKKGAKNSPADRAAAVTESMMIGEKDKGQGKKKAGIVIFRGAGRAIQKTLELGLYFMGQEGIEVKVETGTSFAVDDLEVMDDEGNDRGDQRQEEDVGKTADGEGGGAEVPETRIRKLGYVNVKIWEEVG